jgi:hypothetical protein
MFDSGRAALVKFSQGVDLLTHEGGGPKRRSQFKDGWTN